MASFSYDNIKIAGITCAVPTKKIDVIDYVDQFGEKELKKFMKNTGVLSKYERNVKQTTVDLCIKAAEILIAKKDIDVNTIGAVVLITQTPDYVQPASSHIVHKCLGLKTDCMVYDVNLGCSGYVYGMQISSALLQNGDVKRVLLLTGEVLRSHSGETSKDDLLFGDAAAATLIERGDASLRCTLKSDGKGYNLLIARNGGMRHPYHVDFAETIPVMEGSEVFEFSISRVPEVFEEFFCKFNCGIEDYDYAILHQANLFMLKHIAKKIGLDKDKMPISIDRYGNTSSATIPLTIVDFCEKIEQNKRLRLIASGFGIGLSWGVADFEINTKDVFPMVYTDEYFQEAY